MKRIKSSSCNLPHGIRVAVWLQTDYYRKTANGREYAKADAAMLDELINNIQFTRPAILRAINAAM